MNPQPHPVRVKDSKRLAFVRQMGCLVEYGSDDKAVSEHLGAVGDAMWSSIRSANDCEAHHIRKGSQSGVATKPSDFRTVPFCGTAHDEYHKIGHAKFELKYGLDLEEHIVRINAEYRAQLKKEPSKAKAKQTIIKLEVKNCQCGQTHTIPWAKVIVKTKLVRFWCISRRDYVEVEVA